MARLREYLFTHTTLSGRSAAQAGIAASSYAKAEAIFKERYPDRVITASGIKGGE